jgi:hypothetical protein
MLGFSWRWGKQRLWSKIARLNQEWHASRACDQGIFVDEQEQELQIYMFAKSRFEDRESCLRHRLLDAEKFEGDVHVPAWDIKRLTGWASIESKYREVKSQTGS